MTRSEKRFLSEDENIFRVQYSGEGPHIDEEDDLVSHHIGDTGTVVEIKDLLVTKTYATKDAYLRELGAMQFLQRHHMSGVPRLMAVNETAQRLTLERILGRSFESESGADVDERRIWKLAGEWLRSLHQLPIEDDDQLSFSKAMHARLGASLEAATPHLDATVLAQIETLQNALKKEQISGGVRVFAHRDYRPRNWFVQRDGKFYALDFEHARADFTEWDLVRMIPYWKEKPAMRRAFLSGYRDARQDLSDERLRAAHLVSAIQTIAWGVAHEHDAYVKSGRQLAALAADDYANRTAYVQPA